MLRLIGPNSKYPPFQQAGNPEHRDIFKNLDLLIKKLQNLITRKNRQDPVPDADAGFSSIIVTFTREFYGPLWKKLYSPPNSQDVNL